MQSHLSRRVFRAIVNNEPLHSLTCRNRLSHIPPAYRARNTNLLAACVAQRRTFLPLSNPLPATEQSIILPTEAGLKPMRDLIKSLKDRSRVPPDDVLAKAFRDFFVTRAETPHVMTRFQAHLLIVTWRHLKNRHDSAFEESGPKVWQLVFSNESLENMLFVLSEIECLSEARDEMIKLARGVFQFLSDENGFCFDKVNRPALIAFMNLLSMNGKPEEAHHYLNLFWRRARTWKPSPWLTIMKGYAMKNDRGQLRTIIDDLERRGKGFDRGSHEELTKMLISRGVWDSAKTVYECPISSCQSPSLAVKKAVIKSAVLNSDVEWATPAFESLSQHPLTETMDVLLLWEAAHGKAASNISEQVKLWISENPELKSLLTTSCVNSLIEYANAMGNSQLGAEFAQLAHRWGLEPDMQMHLLVLESRIIAGDLKGALESMRYLNEFGSTAFQDIRLVNKLIEMLCSFGRQDDVFDQVSSFLDPVFESNMHLWPSTIAAMVQMLLYRNDVEAVSELLRPRLGSFEDNGRRTIRKVLVAFIKDYTQDIHHAWDAYGLLKIAFPETGVMERTDIMTSFFKRDRSDLACQVFGHMRQFDEFAKRPKPDTYAKCFQGIARTADAKNLELVHNMLKLDVEVDLNTRILNGLMLAYAACDMPEKAMEIFHTILQSDEGPSWYTLPIFFKVCEKHYNGTLEAIKMMTKLKRLDLNAYRRIYTSYIEALGAQCELNRAMEAIDNMQSEIGVAPTSNT